MSRPQQHKFRLRLVPVVLGLSTALAAAGCAAGQTTETETQVAAVNGASGGVGDVAVRDAQFSFPPQGTVYPAGASAPMRLVLINGSDRDDRLVQVSSPYATSATLGGFTQLPAHTALHAYGKPETKPSVENQPGQSTAPSEPSASAPPQAPGTSATAAPGVPGAAGAPSEQREIKITVHGFKQDIGPGVTIPVTFVFEKAGPVTLQVPLGGDPKPRPEHDSPRGHGGGH